MTAEQIIKEIHESRNQNWLIQDLVKGLEAEEVMAFVAAAALRIK